MRIMTTVVLMSLALGAAGCNSHDSNQVRSDERAVKKHTGAETTVGDVKLPPVVSVPVIDQAAGQATEVIRTATDNVDRATHDVNRTAERVQADAQQVTNDAARLTNDAAKAENNVLNNAAQDLNRFKNALR
jgi:hypothetical protein